MSKPTPKPKKDKKRKGDKAKGQPKSKRIRKAPLEPLDEDDIPDLSEEDEEEEDELEDSPETVEVEIQSPAESTTPKKLPLAVHAMSLMLCGLTKRWKNIIGFHFTDHSFCPKECAEFYRQAIRKSFEAGSKVKAIVMDMSTQNLAV